MQVRGRTFGAALILALGVGIAAGGFATCSPWGRTRKARSAARSTNCACSRCGADLLSTGEILRGMCLRCLNSINDPTCQTYSP